MQLTDLSITLRRAPLVDSRIYRQSFETIAAIAVVTSIAIGAAWWLGTATVWSAIVVPISLLVLAVAVRWSADKHAQRSRTPSGEFSSLHNGPSDPTMGT